MTITQASAPLVPHISAQFKDIKGEKATIYSKNIFKRLPETTFVKLQNIKSAILGKAEGNAWFRQLSKNSSEIINDKKAPIAAVVLAAGGLITALTSTLQNSKVDQPSTFNKAQNLSPPVAPSVDHVDSEGSSLFSSPFTIVGFIIVALASVVAVKSYCSPFQRKIPPKDTNSRTPSPKIEEGKQPDPSKVPTRQADTPNDNVKGLKKTAPPTTAQNNSFKREDNPIQGQMVPCTQSLNSGQLTTCLTEPADKSINFLQKFSYYFKENIHNYTWDERYAILQFQAKKLQELGGVDIVGLFSSRGVVKTTAAMTDNKLIIKNNNVDVLASSIKIMIGQCNCLNINEPNRHEIVQTFSAICTSKPLDLAKLANLIKVTSNEGYDILINILCCLKIISENKAVNKMSEHDLAIEFAPYLFPVFHLDLTANEIPHSNQFDAEAQIIETLINNVHELITINENSDSSSSRALKNDKGNPSSPQTWLSPTRTTSLESESPIDPAREEVARRLFDSVMSSKGVSSVQELLGSSPLTSPNRTSPLSQRSSGNSFSSPPRRNVSSTTPRDRLASPLRLETLSFEDEHDNLEDEHNKSSKYGSQIAGSITNSDLCHNTPPQQDQVNESSETSLFPSIETIRHEFAGACYPVNISSLFRDFLNQKKASPFKNEKEVYQLLSSDWENFWNRLLVNGKTRSLNSFDECISAKWHEHLTPEEELISSLICTERCFTEEPVAAAKSYLPLEYVFNFKSARFNELKNLTDPQCFTTNFDEPNPFLDEKWLKFFFGEKIPTNEERLNSSIKFKRQNSSTAHFDTLVYKKMMLAILTPFVLAANERAKENKAKAFLTLVPISVNKIADQPNDVLAIYDTMSKIQAKCYLEILKDHEILDNFSGLNFSRFGFIDKAVLLELVHQLKLKTNLTLVYNANGKTEAIEIGPKPTESHNILSILQTYQDEPTRTFDNTRRTSFTNLERRYPTPQELGDSNFTEQKLERSDLPEETDPTYIQSESSSSEPFNLLTIMEVDENAQDD